MTHPSITDDGSLKWSDEGFQLQMNCPHCNNTLEKTNNYRFCPYCGAALIEPKNSTIPTTETPTYTADGNEPTPEQRADPKFSETRWFLAATTPEELADASAENYQDIDQLTEPYENPEKLPTQLRKKYSLSETGQQPKMDTEN